ncbi:MULTISPECIES: energy transducer TonB [Chryseobacterium]|uniref:energy transducer TonB n=1 Tax=Chryseobacterium TaxID=59732 RepID=UPI0012964CF7|nr:MULTISPECIES: energy transducer TonB [Chryseobacterium]MDR6921539.1 TonB family protein [Chryseobacterium sp. 2987]
MRSVRILIFFLTVFSLNIKAQEKISDSIKKPGGLGVFRTEVAKQIDLSDFVWKEPFKLVVTFTVSKEGKMENVTLEESSGNAEFDQRILDGIKRMRKKKWTPAKKEGELIESFFRLPLTFHPPREF